MDDDDGYFVSAVIWLQMVLVSIVEEDEIIWVGFLHGNKRKEERGFERGHQKVMRDYFWP